MDMETSNNKILLVDDDPNDVEMALAALEETHLANRVVVARDGAEALDYLYRRDKFESRPDGDPILVLLDNKMPKVSGLQVLMVIKADEHLKMIPVVAFTSSRETPDLMEFYKHGVNAYTVKPMDFAEFMETVKQIGVFWTAVNESPFLTRRKENGTQDGNVTFPERKEGKDEIPPLHAALER
jgi:CheY-like chemotaxis protein